MNVRLASLDFICLYLHTTARIAAQVFQFNLIMLELY